MRIVDPDRSVPELARKFGHTLIPIAAAYLVAHYFSEFVFQEQAQFTYLLSDPLGVGSNLFRHGLPDVWNQLHRDRRQDRLVRPGRGAGSRPRHRLAMAHDRAISLYKDPKEATRSQ